VANNCHSVRSFTELAEAHRELNALFRRHQEALVLRETPQALAALHEFRAALGAHMRAEDEVLLPLYEQVGGSVEGGRPEQFDAEHRKIAADIERIANTLKILAAQPTIEPAEVIELLDEEYRFKHLMDHHERREEKFLFPRLDALLSPEARAKAWESYTMTLCQSQ